jgi:hypothetical protein
MSTMTSYKNAPTILPMSGRPSAACISRNAEQIFMKSEIREFPLTLVDNYNFY